MTTEEQVALFECVKEDNQSAYEKLFRAFYAPLCRFAYQFVKDADESEEIVQEIFTKVWEKRKDLSFTTSFKAYIYTSVRNGCLNKVEKDKVRYIHAEGVKKENANSGYEIPTEVGLEDKIEEAIEKLPEQCRKVFSMSRFDGLKYKEIADKLGISQKTVENQIGKALKILREELKHYLALLILLNIL